MYLVEPNGNLPRRITFFAGSAWVLFSLIYVVFSKTPTPILFIAFSVSVIPVIFLVAWYIPGSNPKNWLDIPFKWSAWFTLFSTILFCSVNARRNSAQIQSFSFLFENIMIGIIHGVFILIVSYPVFGIAYYIARRLRIFVPHCQKCFYNLTGNTSGTCPECGTPIPALIQSDSSGMNEAEAESQPGDPNCSS